MATGANKLKLVQPTDFEILTALKKHGRNVATNIALHLDRNKDYINTRLPALEDYGLVEKIGPSERSGLYEITEKGEQVLACQDQYGEVDDFDALIESTES